jgi:hypothetical protein
VRDIQPGTVKLAGEVAFVTCEIGFGIIGAG